MPTHSQDSLVRLDELRAAVGRRVRTLSIAQIAALAFADARRPVNAARQFVRREISRGEWNLHYGMSLTLPCFERPMYRWVAGAAVANASRLSHFACYRWKGHYRSVAVVTSANRSPITLRRPRRLELSHDLAVSSLYFNLLSSNRSRADGWVHEDLSASAEDTIVPDAVILECDGTSTYVELLGRYSSAKVSRMLTAYINKGATFEFW